MNKIINISNLDKKIFQLRNKNLTIVHCHGVFDLIHIGHIKYLEEAKKLGDCLIVSLTESKFIQKGPNRPLFNNQDRLHAISSLSCIDYVCLNKSETAEEIIKIIKPNYYVKGPDYKILKNDLTSNIYKEIKEVEKFGGKFVTTKTPIHSSSSIINSNFSHLSKSQKKIINKIKNQYPSFNLIKNKIDELKKKKILIIGETIIDEYVFCEALGKASKDLNINLKKIYGEKYAGGILAIARNLQDYCGKIDIISFIGENKDQLNFISSKISKNVKFNYLIKNNSSTIIKTRFLDIVDKIKLLGVYQINDEELTLREQKKFINKINKFNDYDMVIVTDYNHGIITKKVASKISAKFKNKFCLNCQLNSSNIRYQALSKYKNIKFVVINETELRYEFRDRTSDISILAKKLINKLKILSVLVTSGRRGMTYFSSHLSKSISIDAFSDYAVDKVGAGDTVLGFFSAMMASNASVELSLLISSLAARHSVRDMGNKNPFEKINLITSLNYLLK